MREVPLRIGDEVSLASGGPVMTVVSASDTEVVVRWWDPRWDPEAKKPVVECGRYAVDRFPPEALVLMDDEDEEDDGEELAS